nr:MAG: hypothetical protein [flactilig virus 10]
MKSFKISDLYIQNNYLRIFFSLVLFLLTFLLLIPRPAPVKKRNSEVYEDLSEEVPLTNMSPKFNCNL